MGNKYTLTHPHTDNNIFNINNKSKREGRSIQAGFDTKEFSIGANLTANNIKTITNKKS